MAEKEKEEFSDDALAQAFRYRTIWTNSLFESGNDIITISRFGKINLRIEKAVIIWSIVGITIGVILTLTLFKWILPDSIFLLAGGLFTFMFTLVLVQVGLWSPMRKSTGEDLITYLKFRARNSIASGGLFNKQTKSGYISRAFKDHPEGRPVSGKMG